MTGDKKATSKIKEQSRKRRRTKHGMLRNTEGANADDERRKDTDLKYTREERLIGDK